MPNSKPGSLERFYFSIHQSPGSRVIANPGAMRTEMEYSKEMDHYAGKVDDVEPTVSCMLAFCRMSIDAHYAVHCSCFLIA